MQVPDSGQQQSMTFIGACGSRAGGDAENAISFKLDSDVAD